MKDWDIFITNKIYPNAEKIFALSVKPLERIKDECIFVIDTNSLLIPYKAAPKSLNEIKKVYVKLIEEKRLIIPGQVAREFAKQRPERIKELFKQLEDKKFKLFGAEYPLLEDIKEYKEVLGFKKEINELHSKYNKSIENLMSEIKKWTWNDPISAIYQELFLPEVVFDLPKIDEDKVKKELDNRYKHKIPPGYKDQRKKDDGIGDLLIWHTILAIGEEKNKDVVFVSGEEKADWIYKSAGRTLYPRFELIYEFARCCDEKSFQIINFPELLNLFDTEESVVAEIENISEESFRECQKAKEIEDIRRSVTEEPINVFELFEEERQRAKEMEDIRRSLIGDSAINSVFKLFEGERQRIRNMEKLKESMSKNSLF